jgi:MFS family permease
VFRVEQRNVLPHPNPPAPLWQAGTLVYNKPALRMLFFWLLWGDFTLMLRERSVQPTFQLLLKQFHASDLVLALLVTVIPQAVTMVLGPVISYRSDRHRSPRGRRIPYLLIPTPLCFLGMVGLAFGPEIGMWLHPALEKAWRLVASVYTSTPREWTVNASILTTIAICWTLFEIFAIMTVIIYNALVADVVPRSVMGRFFGLFRVISLADGIFFMLVLIQYAEAHYKLIFCAVGALFATSFTLMCFMVTEGEYPPEADSTSRPRSFIEAVRIYLRECFANSYYRWITLSIALSMMAFVPINTYSIYFAKSLNMDMKWYGRFSAIQFALSLLQAYPIGWLADKLHPIRLVIASFFLHGITVFLAFFLVQGTTSFGVFHVLTGTCAGFWLTAYSPLLPALLPRSRYATRVSAMGATGLAAAIGTIVIGFALGLFLDHVMVHQYRWIYVWSLALDALALGATIVVYGKFKSFGGMKNYAAPE